MRPAFQAPRCGHVPWDTRPHCHTSWQSPGVQKGRPLQPWGPALGLVSARCLPCWQRVTGACRLGLSPGKAKGGPEQPSLDPAHRGWGGVCSSGPCCKRPHRRRRKQRISKTKSRWSVKDPRTPSPQPCPAPLHPPCCRGTLSSASKTRQLGQAEGRPTAQPSSQADPPHPGSLLSCRPLPLLGVPWATCGGGGQSDTPAPSPKACCVQAECARACTHPAQTPCSCKELKGFWAVCYC